MTLYHYTCHHSVKGITRRGMIRPTPHPLIPDHRIVWLTDMATPDRDALGLTSDYLACDRLAFRYLVDAEDAEPWATFAARASVPFLSRAYLETGRAPDRWFVVTRSVLGKLDRTYGLGSR